MSAAPTSDAMARAVAWLERLDDAGDDAGVRAEFDAWLAESPENEGAFARAQRVARAADESVGHERFDAMRASALSLRPQRNWARPMAAAAAVLIVAGVGLVATLQLLEAGESAAVAGVYETGLGERASVTLGDGSVVTLNTNSRLEVAFRPERRAVTLARGQALFEVAKDATRPFTVDAGGRRVTALGTAFDVRLDEAAMQVTLIEGRVSVTPTPPDLSAEASAKAEALAKGVELDPGEAFAAPLDVAIDETLVAAADVSRATSWREGRLIFENDTLADAVAEVNRYAPAPLVIADAEIAQYRVTGVFRTGQTASFVAAVQSAFPVGTLYGDAGEIRLVRRD